MFNNNSFAFSPRSEQQVKLFLEFKKLRAAFGSPHPFAYMRALAKTRRYTRTVYPPEWRLKRSRE